MKDPILIDKESIIVSREWFDHAMKALGGDGGCPFCGSERAPVVAHENDRTFKPRKGCLDCDTWFTPVEFR